MPFTYTLPAAECGLGRDYTNNYYQTDWGSLKGKLKNMEPHKAQAVDWVPFNQQTLDERPLERFARAGIEQYLQQKTASLSEAELIRRRRLIQQIMQMAEKEQLPIFACTSGASGTSTLGDAYIKQLRDNHAAYERSIGDNPNEDWSGTDYTKMANYDPPWNHQQIRENYGEEVYKKLVTDPAHSWRMDSGIELIHQEPSQAEQERIYANWLLMDQAQKELSNQKSLELFGKDNEAHHNELLGIRKLAR